MSTPLQETLQTLLALQAVDSHIQRILKAQKALDDGTASLAALRAATASLAAATATHHHAAGALKDSELKLAAVETKRKNFEQKLYDGKVTNPKELANIEKEVGALGRQRSDLDEQVLVLMDEAEAAKAEADKARAAAAEASAHHDEIIAHYKVNFKELDRQIAGLRVDREKAVVEVPDRALLKRYEDMRPKMNGLAIVTVAGGDCGGCHMTLPNALVKSVREGETMYTCENCRRILTA